MAQEDVELHRQLGKELFNRVWDLLNLEQRTPVQDAEMIHTTHASAYHWAQVGEGPRLARAEWQCSWVYSELARPEPALYHAHRCEALCREHAEELEDFEHSPAFSQLEKLVLRYAVAMTETPVEVADELFAQLRENTPALRSTC